MHALCRRMLGNEADALDATQDALLAAIRGLSRFDGRSSFGTWLYRIATNACIDETRRRRRRPVTGFAADVAEVADEVSSAPGVFIVPTRGGARSFEGSSDREVGWQRAAGVAGVGAAGRPGPSEGRRRAPVRGDSGGEWARDPAEVVAARMDVDAALALLPVEFRTAVVLREVCDLPYDEIADILNIPVGTVRSRIARARSALATTWKADREPTSDLDRDEHRATGNSASSRDVRTVEGRRASATDTSRARVGRRSPPGPLAGQSQQDQNEPKDKVEPKDQGEPKGQTGQTAPGQTDRTVPKGQTDQKEERTR